MSEYLETAAEKGGADQRVLLVNRWVLTMEIVRTVWEDL